MLYMLDTDTSSYIIRGGYGKIERRLDIVSPTLICISAMTRAELVYGLQRLRAEHHLSETVYDFLRVMRMLEWGAKAADFHAQIKHQLKTDGTPIGDMDMLIAAHALAADAVLVTNNTRHFERIRLPLMMENWME